MDRCATCVCRNINGSIIIPDLGAFRVAKTEEFYGVEIRIIVRIASWSGASSENLRIITHHVRFGRQQSLWAVSTSSGLVRKQRGTGATRFSVCAMQANIVLSFSGDLRAGLARSGNSRRSQAGQTEHGLWRGSSDERKHFVHGNSTRSNSDRRWHR